MKIGVQGLEKLDRAIGSESALDVKTALNRLNSLTAVAAAFYSDLGGGPASMGDSRLLVGRIYRNLLNARIRADVFLRSTYLKNPDKFIEDGYALSDVASAGADVVIALRNSLDEYNASRRKNVVVPESTLARVNKALGQ